MTTPEVLLALRHTPDRWLHTQRHNRAVELTPALIPGDRLLVVCYGNVCRSPFAAAVLQRALARTGIVVDSAGFVGPGRPVPLFAHVTALELGLSLTGHRSQVLTETMVRDARHIVVMDAAQRAQLTRRDSACPVPQLLGDLDPLPIAKRAVRDPWGQSLPVFAEVFARIERCAMVLALAIGAANARASKSPAYSSA